MQAANLAWGGCVRKRKGAVPLCSNQAQEIKSGGRNREASGLVWTRRALRVKDFSNNRETEVAKTFVHSQGISE